MSSLAITPIQFIITFAVGLAVGSFLNVIILRHEKGEKPQGRSYCPHCNKTLSWFELFPLVSYIIQLGRCNNCKHQLSIQYPLVEFGTGLLFVVIFHNIVGPISDSFVPTYFLGAVLLLHLVIWSLFMVIAVYDLRTKLIPDKFSFMLAFSTFLLLFIGSTSFEVPSYWAFAAGPLLYLPFFVLWMISGGRWIGLGDAKLSLGIGWYLGLSLGGTAIMLAFWVGAVVSVGVIMFQKLYVYSVKVSTGTELTLKSEVPFGPFLVLGTLIVYMFGIDMFSDLIYLF